MVVFIEVAQVVVAVLQDDEYLVVVEELSQQLSVLVVVQSFHVGIVPHLSTSECGVSTALQSDTVHGILRQQVTLRGPSLDHHLREVLLDEDLLDLGIRVECHLDDLCLTVGVRREVHHLRARRTYRQVVFLVARHRSHVEALDEVPALLTVTVDGVVDGTRVVLLEHAEVEHVLADEEFLGHTDDLVLAVLVEDDDIVEVGAVADELVLLQTGADEAVSTVDVEFLVRLCHLRGLDSVEVAYLRQSWVVLAVFILEELEPVGRHLRQVRQVALYLLDLCLQSRHELVGLVLVELQDALHLDLEQLQDIVLRHLTHEGGVVGRQSFVNMFADLVDVGCLLEFLVLIDAFLDKDFLQRLEVELFEQFVLADLEFLTDEVLRAVCRVAQHVADGEELWLVVLDDATVGRDVDLAVGKGIEGVDGLV